MRTPLFLLLLLIGILSLLQSHSSPPAAAASSAPSAPSTSHAVHAWLDTFGLAQYGSIFEAHQIEGDALLTLTSSSLLAYGIAPLGHRKKILARVATLAPSADAETENLKGYDDQDQNQKSDLCDADATGQTSECTANLASSSSPSTPPPSSSSSPPRSATKPRPRSSTHGWYIESHPHQYDSSRCNIAERSYSLTLEEFERDFFLKQPVLLRADMRDDIDVEDERQDRRAFIDRTRQHWTRSHLLKTHGNVRVQLGTPQQLTAYGEGRLHMSLREYINELEQNTSLTDTHYLFDRNTFFTGHTRDEMLTTYRPPALFMHQRYSTTITFALGPTGSGINFHYHRDGWNELIFGRKRWLMYAPSTGSPPYGFNQFESAKRWYDTNYHRLTPDQLTELYECIQHPGDTMYVPEDWYHATINIGETMAIAGQSHHAEKGTLMYDVHQGMESNGDGKVKIAHFRKALARFPGYSQVHNLIGNQYKILQDTDAAIKEYKLAVKYNPLYALAWTSLGNMLLVKYQVESQSQSVQPRRSHPLLSEALSAFRTSNTLGPDVFDTLLGLGNTLYFFGELEESKKWLEESIRVMKGDIHANNNNNNAPQKQNQDPNQHLSQSQPSYINLVVIYTTLNQPKRAVQLAREWLRSFPADYRMMIAYAGTLRKMGKLKQARRMLNDIPVTARGEYQLAMQEMSKVEEDMKHEAQEEEKKKNKATSKTASPSQPSPSSSTVTSLNWRQTFLTQYLTSQISQHEQAPLPTPTSPFPEIHLFIAGSSQSSSKSAAPCPGFSLRDVSGTKCFSSNSIFGSSSSLSSINSLLDIHGSLLSLTPHIHTELQYTDDWLAWTTSDEVAAMGKESGFLTLLGNTKKTAAFMQDLYTLPYTSNFGTISQAVIGVDAGPTSVRRPEFDFYKTLPSESVALLKGVMKKLGHVNKEGQGVLPFIPRGILFYSNRLAMTRLTFNAYIRFLFVFLDAALVEDESSLTTLSSTTPLRLVGITDSSRNRFALSPVLEHLPFIWAYHSSRPLFWTMIKEYLHENRRSSSSVSVVDGKQQSRMMFDDEIVEEKWTKLMEKYTDKELRDRFHVLLKQE